MKQPLSGSPNLPTDGKPSNLDWKQKDYGLGPEPAKGSPDWFDWIETRAQIAGLKEAAGERKDK